MAEGVLKYTGCSLEVFDADIDELASGSIPERMRYNGLKVGDFIVRRAVCDINRNARIPTNSLDDFLKAVDEHFTVLAGSINATVVAYTWGLVKRTPSRKHYSPDLEEPFGIADYVLGAKTLILPGRKLNILVDPGFGKLQKKLHDASSGYVVAHGFTTDADYPEQFTTFTQQGITTLVLHDIDPKIRAQSSGPITNS